MNPPNTNTEHTAALRDEIAKVVASAWALAQQKDIPDSQVEPLLDPILQIATQQEDYPSVKAAIQPYLQAARRLESMLQTMLEHVETLEASLIQQQRYIERWWQKKRQALYVAFQENPQRGLSEWLRLYAEALIEWELGICDKLTHEPFSFPSQAMGLPTLFQNGTQAIKEERYEQALDMLTYLAQVRLDDQSQPVLDRISRAAVLIFIGRIYLYRTSDPEMALRYFEEAKESAPNDGRPYAALGEYYQAHRDEASAKELYHQAIEVSPDEPEGEAEGHIGLGLLLEAESLWDEADDEYEEAITTFRKKLGITDVGVALGKLLAPVSGNLYLQLARMLTNDNAELALEAVTRAISIGIKYEGDYPDRVGYRRKGKILERLERQTEAAEAYYEAGRRFHSDSEYAVAEELLNHAATLKPDHAPTYRYLAEALYMSSYLTEPPYVDEASIKNSLKAWEAGIEIALPDADSSWAYVIRALINEQLSRLPDNDERASSWEAIAYLERAILLNDANPYSWALLGRYHRYLSTESSSLQATKVVDDFPEDPLVLGERAAILANAGQFAAAEETIDKLREVEPSAWADGVKAVILFHVGNYQDALELAQISIEAAPKDLWLREIRAACYKRLGEQSLAMEDNRWIWERHDDPSYRGNESSFAWAAYQLGMIEEAIEIYNRLREDPVQSGSAYRNLGLCYLVKGALRLAAESLDIGIRLATAIPQLDELRIDLKDIERSSANPSNGARVREVLDQAKETMRRRRAQLEQPPSAEEELRSVVATLQRRGETDGWPWIGANAGLARLLGEQERWSEAAALYQLLSKESDRFPEARIGLGNVITKLQEEGDRHLQAGEPDRALERFSQALSLVLESMADQQEKRGDLQSRFGYAHFELGDFASARENFVQAIELYRGADLPDPGKNLGAVCRSLLQGATQYWALDAEWKAWAEASASPEILQANLMSAREALAEYFNELYQLSGQLGEPKEPFVTPIMLEIGEGLIPEDTGPDWSLFKTYLPEMRTRLENQMGALVPGVRVHLGNLPPEGYRITLDEITHVEGSVKLDRRYCPASPDVLQQQGILEHALLQAPNPLTGEPGCWIQPDDRRLVTGLELWDEPLLFVIYHLEAVLRHNLGDFVGVQETEGLLEKWEQHERGPHLIRAALPDQASRLHFARMLRSLLRENVPITAWEDILEVVHTSKLTNHNIGGVVRAVRLRLKRLLPGNDLTTRRLELPPELEDATASWLRHENGKVSFAASPQETHEFVATIRDLVRPNDRNLVLVTRSTELRPFIRRLIEFEFPYLMVLSQEELLSHDELVEEIRIEDAAQNEGTNTDE